MKTTGIDASLTGTGVAVIDDIDPAWKESFTLAIQSRQTGPARLIEIRDRVREIVADADLVAIEGYAYAMPNQAHQMGELGGVLRVMLVESGVEWIEVAPSQVKKFASGKGNAKKEELAVAIFKRWGREFRTNDEADAFVLAVIGQAYLFDAQCQTAFQTEVIQELRNPKVGRKKAAKKAG